MIYGLILGIHLIVCVSLVLTVLLQSGKGGGLAGAFGGGGSTGQALFGGRGAATFLSKATTGLGVAFMTTSLVLALLSGGQGPRSVLRDAQPGPGSAPPPVGSQPLQIPGDENLTLPPLGEPQAGAEAQDRIEVSIPVREAPAATEEGEEPTPSPGTTDDGGGN